MRQRGRPKTPGILTARELEVLGLLRQGLSNRDIAESLGISLAGAKFHVSEIITKLGVSSREEAALWRPRQPGIFLAWLAEWRRWKPGRFVQASIAGTALLVMGALFVLSLGNRDHGPTQTAVAPTATSGAIRLEDLQVASLEEAQRRATFHILMPSHVPEGYQLTNVYYYKLDFRCPTEVDVNHCERVHNDHVTTRFEADPASSFMYSQGYGGLIAVSHHFAPAAAKGVVAIDGRRVHWVRGHMRPGIAPSGGQPTEDSDWIFNDWISVSWFQSRDENPSGGDSPRCMGLHSTSLSLETLLEIAASVPLSVANPAQDHYEGRC